MRQVIVVLSFFIAASPALAEAEVALDVGFSRQVLAEVCSGETINRDAIRKDPTVLHMLAHFSQFRDYFTMDAYLDARQQAANCTVPARDMFRFGGVIENRESLARLVDDLAADAEGYSGAVSMMLSPYAPVGLAYSGRAVPVVGSPSCGGWSKGADFFVDLPCISGDPEGLKYLIAHESYHGMQDRFMWDTEGAAPIVRLLGEVLREGSATAFADFSEIENPGDYAALSQRVIKVNDRRTALNFQLLDMAVQYALTFEGGYDAANNIGLSGAYDSPFYYVGVTMVRAIEAASGRERLLELLAAPPQEFFKRYEELAEAADNLPSLGPVLKEWLAKN